MKLPGVQSKDALRAVGVLYPNSILCPISSHLTNIAHSSMEVWLVEVPLLRAIHGHCQHNQAAGLLIFTSKGHASGLTAKRPSTLLPDRSCGWTARNLNSCSRAMKAATLSWVYGTSKKVTTKESARLLLLLLLLSMLLLSIPGELLLPLLPPEGWGCCCCCCWWLLLLLIGSTDKLPISRCVWQHKQQVHAKQ